MKTIDILTGQANEPVKISTLGNEDIIAYRISVDRWKGTITQVDNWPGSAAESADGVHFDMTPADGYDITIKASVKSSANPTIHIELSLGAAITQKYDVAFPSDEGPVVTRDWNIFLDKA